MNDSVRAQIERIVGAPVVAHEPVSGGYTPAKRWRVTLAGGHRVFVKHAASDSSFAFDALRRELEVYPQLERVGASFAPRFLGGEGGPDHQLLVVQDLGEAYWPPPWRPDDLARVADTLRRLEATPLDVPPLDPTGLRDAWAAIEAQPDAFLSTGLASERWLRTSLPTLREASRRAPSEPLVTLHQDVRSDNLCLVGGEHPQVVLIDWPETCRGPRGLDLAFLALTARLEGGPLPDALVPNVGDHVAWVAGFFASRAGLPAVPDAPRVRWIQHRQLRIALPWAARVLGLDPPDGSWAQDAVDLAHRAADAGEIDDATWQVQVEEALIDAYLATASPTGGSGKSGDEVDWRWSRAFVLDAIEGSSADVLDVGCANGHLLASFEAWGRERGLAVTAHGLEVSSRMAQVARRRLPAFADRIHEGDVMTWVPPRRYDLVHTGLDYVRPARRRALVDRILAHLLVPGGRLVVRAERVLPGRPGPAEVLRSLGLEPGGVLESAHPQSGLLRQTAWVAMR